MCGAYFNISLRRYSLLSLAYMMNEMRLSFISTMPLDELETYWRSLMLSGEVIALYCDTESVLVAAPV